ncbi:MAG: AtpZ/AtpI family protein [Holophaga sp.]|nr:AtpZ/AtpI family protein [Holophaga sp.]
MLFQRKDKGVDPRERALWGDLMGLGMVFPIAIVAGFFLGRWIGGLFGHPRAGMWVGLAWGVATGFWELYKTTVRLDRYDEAEKKEKDDSHGG